MTTPAHRRHAPHPEWRAYRVVRDPPWCLGARAGDEVYARHVADDGPARWEVCAWDDAVGDHAYVDAADDEFARDVAPDGGEVPG